MRGFEQRVPVNLNASGGDARQWGHVDHVTVSTVTAFSLVTQASIMRSAKE